jgi:hypothetical protein
MPRGCADSGPFRAPRSSYRPCSVRCAAQASLTVGMLEKSQLRGFWRLHIGQRLRPAAARKSVFNEIRSVTSVGHEPLLTPRARVVHRPARRRRTRCFPPSALRSRPSHVQRRTHGTPAPRRRENRRSGDLVSKIVSAMDRLRIVVDDKVP